MALRIHFTAEDLARTTVAARPDVMWELTLSLHQLQASRPAARCRPWVGHVRDRLRGRGRPDLRGVLNRLTALVPPRGSFPDFLTPPGQPPLEDGLELIRSTRRRALAADLAAVFRTRERPLWVRQLADGDREGRRELARALAVYHRELVHPCLAGLDETLFAERAACGRRVLDGGVGRLLGTLSPTMRWAWPVLSADYPVDRDLRLGGRGITLVPSFFCVAPVTLIDPELPPVLVYPAREGERPGAPGAGAGAGTRGRACAAVDGLAPVLGRTRALAIRALTHPCSTSELALRIGVSAASASRHATALRDAGLVTSTRLGGEVLHVATPLGAELAGAGVGGSGVGGGGGGGGGAGVGGGGGGGAGGEGSVCARA
ncbi:winged helix-turn-helix domain-containing protein [Streptomyces sp. B-S-A8]|uniref:Winged helix-turn-helix domain-containing protein n=1 Tax=Streptomyces solicavernae TaxID=3043614 RepID=A0ABT6RNU5_9ACTN|nr:winged helix-turn-helix domain-containing protein [Streptomyces sp. B-S-A8]MDI3386077.1 winged helix-turn-helix domain-containing protein [Streptomyces sp. B-S-A8]